ncbi:MAG: hypothetical protein ACREJT_12270, partial [Myxococcota bacterium]
FALPDLRGRAAQGIGALALGEKAGAEAISDGPSASYVSGITPKRGLSSSTQTAAVAHASDARQPYLAVNYCIALVGVFPSRN